MYARRPHDVSVQGKERWSAAAASRFQGSGGTIGVNGRLLRELIAEDFQFALIQLCLSTSLHLTIGRKETGFHR